MAIFVWDSFQLLSQLAPDTRLLGLLKTIYNTKWIWDKKSESVDVRPKRVVGTRRTNHVGFKKLSLTVPDLLIWSPKLPDPFNHVKINKGQHTEMPFRAITKLVKTIQYWPFWSNGNERLNHIEK